MNILYSILFVFTTLNIHAQGLGCTDHLAKNYNKLATINNGSCIYSNKSVKPILSYNLPDYLNETSGLFLWDNLLWTHNDDKDFAIYGYKLDSLPTANSKKIEPQIKLSLTNITDWEATTQDEDYIYVGDFGNNYKGNRTNLVINKIAKNNIYTDSLKIEELTFKYETQTEYNKLAPNTTNFDCEAFISKGDSLYLFTKEWSSLKTTVYSIAKSGKNQIAKQLATYNINGLVTDATYVENKNILVLCGYSKHLKPFIYLFYDFNETNFFKANKRKIKVKLPFHQLEGITTFDGLTYYISNEKLKYLKGLIDVEAQIHVLDLSKFLQDYISIFVNEKAKVLENKIPIKQQISNTDVNEIFDRNSD